MDVWWYYLTKKYKKRASPPTKKNCFIRCAVSLMVPILRIVGDGLTSNSKALGEVLNAGFNVNFSDPYTRQCLDCRLSGRQCGFDWNSSRPICICGHSLCNGACIWSFGVLLFLVNDKLIFSWFYDNSMKYIFVRSTLFQIAICVDCLHQFSWPFVNFLF